MGRGRRHAWGSKRARRRSAPGRSPWLGPVLVALVLAPAVGPLAGCAPIRGWSAERAAPQPAALREDGGPRIYDEDQVDVPARPIVPIRPEYPPRMRALGIPGEVEARVIVRKDGTFGGGRIVETTNDEFADSAREAIRVARFHPALRAGRAVASWVTLRVHFEIDH